jgi:hypothetical protein
MSSTDNLHVATSGRLGIDTRIDADSTSFLKNRRLVLACRQINMRLDWMNVDGKWKSRLKFQP